MIMILIFKSVCNCRTAEVKESYKTQINVLDIGNFRLKVIMRIFGNSGSDKNALGGHLQIKICPDWAMVGGSIHASYFIINV